MSFSQVFAKIPSKSLLIGLFVTSMIIQISAQSIAPILALYIRYLGQSDNILFYSGLIVSAMGFSSLLSTPYLGRLGDRIGNHRLLLMGLFYSFLCISFVVLQVQPCNLAFTLCLWFWCRCLDA